MYFLVGGWRGCQTRGSATCECHQASITRIGERSQRLRPRCQGAGRLGAPANRPRSRRQGGREVKVKRRKPTTRASTAPEPGVPTSVRTTGTAAIRSPACAERHGCAACLLEPHCHTRARSDPHLALINEPAVALFGQASLIMSNLRTKRRENVGWGYTNQTAEGQRE